MKTTLARVVALAALSVFVLVPTAANADPGFYTGPIFGVSTGPHNTLLVADASQGVVNGDTGQLIAKLPGIADVDAIAGTREMWAVTGAGDDPEADTGQAFWRIDANGNATLLANLFEFEKTFNPHPASIDSNPFDVEDLGGGQALVADAGGNTLLKIDRHGNVQVVAVLPNEQVSTANAAALLGVPFPPTLDAQPVATSVVIGRDGHFYVGELKGFPAPIGESRVWKISPHALNAKCGQSSLCSVALDGLTSIVDLQFGPDGRLYAAQIDDHSWLAVELAAFEGAPIHLAGSVRACNLATKACSTVVSGKPVLTSITFRNHRLWGATNSFFPGTDVTPLP